MTSTSPVGPSTVGQTPVWKTPGVLALGLVSFLTDVASEMIFPLLPGFVAALPGGGPLAVGTIEGIAEATASGLKYVSGRLSDHWNRRKPLVLAGYGLSSLARPLVALAATPAQVLLVRIADRTGKGLRTSPRDALLAAAVPPGRRGEAFGFHRSMDHSGAVVGPLLAWAWLSWVSPDLPTLFLLAGVPGLLSVLVVAFGVREEGVPGAGPEAPCPIPATDPGPATTPAPAATPSPSPGPEPENPRKTRLLLALAIFSLGRASEAFLLLLLGQHGHAPGSLPLWWLGLHLVKASFGLPGGRLADRWGAGRTLRLTWLAAGVVAAGLAVAEADRAVLLLAAWGVVQGLMEGPERALVAEVSPKGAQGRTFGSYHLVAGLSVLAANLLFGGIWQAHGRGPAFAVSASLAILGALALPADEPRVVPGSR